MVEITALLYHDLRELARRELSSERADHTLVPTALVHEAWLRLGGPDASFESRAHFFGAAARAIRRVLIEHARRRTSARRDAGRAPTTLGQDAPAAADERDDGLWLALDAALERLAVFSPRKARLVELRFFAGLSADELARALDVSEATLRREWRLTRAWLRAELGEDAGV